MPFTKDRGIDMRIPTGVNLTGLSTGYVEVKKPSGGAAVEYTCTIFDMENGVLRYVTPTTSDLLNDPGEWQAQAKIIFSSGEIFHGAIVKFTVAPVLV
jgi:CO dehydrogenase/acetyl-CoA synthase delta subunit